MTFPEARHVTYVKISYKRTGWCQRHRHYSSQGSPWIHNEALGSVLDTGISLKEHHARSPEGLRKIARLVCLSTSSSRVKFPCTRARELRGKHRRSSPIVFTNSCEEAAMVTGRESLTHNCHKYTTTYFRPSIHGEPLLADLASRPPVKWFERSRFFLGTNILQRFTQGD